MECKEVNKEVCTTISEEVCSPTSQESCSGKPLNLKQICIISSNTFLTSVCWAASLRGGETALWCLTPSAGMSQRQDLMKRKVLRDYCFERILL